VSICVHLWFHSGGMSDLHLVARYHEIALKRGNRGQFVRQLSQNIIRMLRGTGVNRIYHGPGRVILPLPDPASWPEVRQRLGHVFGLSSVFLCHRCERDIEALVGNIVAALGQRRVESFAIRTKRADKRYPLPSPEVSRLVGRAVQDHLGARVDLTHPELEIYVDILDREAFFSLEKIDAPGGLPLGSSGTVLALLSGGIDSPVAAYRMMGRGCRMEFIHFHGAPYQGRASQDKARELVGALSRWHPDAQLHLVAFGEVQREIVTAVPRRFRVVLYRRMMVRIAEALARRIGAEALVTGESLGQVASQTLTNLVTIEDACTLPILRPLIGMDKQEISAQAEQIGTYPISIQPDEDCCQLFVPRHPSTRMTLEEARRSEEAFDVAAMVDSALAGVQTVTVTFPVAGAAPGERGVGG
jgi:thiamine biosynthesis protein ThiI